MPDTTVRLGLIGDNIARSQSPLLHVLAGRLCGLTVTYDRLIPADLGRDFGAVFGLCKCEGFRGINITYPYKEQVTALVGIADPAIAAIGACNTVVFDRTLPSGHNTDYTGFMSAFRKTFGAAFPGKVAMAGAGGVGKAVAFGLAGLGCTHLAIFDRDSQRAWSLRLALERSGSAMAVEVVPAIEDAAADADGLINCTPLGMVGYPGTAIPKAVLGRQRWAFDAVYTPVDTVFMNDARAAGLAVISGYELFFHQGVDAFHFFTGAAVDPAALRAELIAAAAETGVLG
ncbi:shikimate dehydrogenase [Phyllobacterium salinisoli]|uniref:Shikimate dehydrogenase n=1 Tax=Phyllobacterium salinisoli TaxID=1899321 RepID=A0A368K0Y4_9HYPH|nr:shikimate dehydrogenase [Phyllobacterium salinisoli]RCS22062.1 shikimate dehydrogenase [Phyllobacterium salinisoli]